MEEDKLAPLVKWKRWQEVLEHDQVSLLSVLNLTSASVGHSSRSFLRWFPRSTHHFPSVSHLLQYKLTLDPTNMYMDQQRSILVDQRRTRIVYFIRHRPLHPVRRHPKQSLW